MRGAAGRPSATPPPAKDRNAGQREDAIAGSTPLAGPTEAVPRHLGADASGNRKSRGNLIRASASLAHAAKD